MEIDNIMENDYDEISTENEENISPLSVSNFVPESTTNLICQITPAKFDSLLKVLNVLITDKGSNESLIIRNSAITQSVSGSVINSDIHEIFDSDKINLQIINPKKYIRLFKNFRNNNDIFILDDIENSRFIITNGEIKLFLPKQVETLIEDVKLPDLSNCSLICNTKIDKAARNMITSLANDAKYIEYLIQDSLFKGIHIPDTAIFLFNEYISDPKASKLDETNADLTLRSTVIFPIQAEDYEISIGLMSDASYISATRCNTGFVKVDAFESLEITTGGNFII
jgi:hypothetical protein